MRLFGVRACTNSGAEFITLVSRHEKSHLQIVRGRMADPFPIPFTENEMKSWNFIAVQSVRLNLCGHGRGILFAVPPRGDRLKFEI